MNTDDEKSTSNWLYEASCTSHCEINRGLELGTYESLDFFCTTVCGGQGVEEAAKECHREGPRTAILEFL